MVHKQSADKLIDVSIRAPRERGDLAPVDQWFWVRVSIRAPRERGDDMAQLLEMYALFQSAPLVRGAIGLAAEPFGGGDVSIRAPRERGDRLGADAYVDAVVSIRAPRERGDTM